MTLEVTVLQFLQQDLYKPYIFFASFHDFLLAPFLFALIADGLIYLIKQKCFVLYLFERINLQLS